MTFKPFIHESMTRSDYDDLPYLNFSSLKQGINRNGYYTLVALKRKAAPSLPMKFGSAFHTYVLEPDQFQEEWKVIQGSQKTTTKKNHITETEYNTIRCIDRSLAGACKRYANDSPLSIQYALSHVKKRIEVPGLSRQTETSIVWRYQDVKCKARIDAVIADNDTPQYVIVDLKTCGDPQPHFFRWDIKKYRYDLQMAFYMIGLQQVLGLSDPATQLSACLVACGKYPPYETNFVVINYQSIQHNGLGEQIDRLIQDYKEAVLYEPQEHPKHNKVYSYEQIMDIEPTFIDQDEPEPIF